MTEEEKQPTSIKAKDMSEMKKFSKEEASEAQLRELMLWAMGYGYSYGQGGQEPDEATRNNAITKKLSQSRPLSLPSDEMTNEQALKLVSDYAAETKIPIGNDIRLGFALFAKWMRDRIPLPSKDNAVEFAEWIAIEGWERVGKGDWHNGYAAGDLADKNKNMDELYSLFLSSQNEE